MCSLTLVLAFRIIWIFVCHTSANSLWLTYVNPFFRITDYFIGMLLGANIDVIKLFILNRKCYCRIFSCAIWISFIGYVIALSISTLPWYHLYLRTPLSLGLIILFMVSGGCSKLHRISLYENKFLIYIGNISFELFLIHTQIKLMTAFVFTKLSISNIFLELITIFIVSVILAQMYSYVENIIVKKKYERFLRKI